MKKIVITGATSMIGTAGQLWDCLYCDDAEEAFYHVGEKSSGKKVYCLGSGTSRPLRDYIYSIRDYVNP